MLGPSNNGGGNNNDKQGPKGLLGALLKDTKKRNAYNATNTDKTDQMMKNQALGSLSQFASDPTSSNSNLKGASPASTGSSSDKPEPEKKTGSKTASRLLTVPIIKEKTEEKKSRLKYADDDEEDFFRR